MRLLIDNGDGLGALDYTQAILAEGTATVHRVAGAFARCQATLQSGAAGLKVPVARARVQLLSDGGAAVFQGYCSQAALDVREIANGSPVIAFEALEDAWLQGVAPEVALEPPTAALHALPLDGSTGSVSLKREIDERSLAGDVTVSGAVAATRYVTELFRGDGTTTTFELLDTPFRESGSGTLIQDSFDETEFAGQVWQLNDPGSYLRMGSGGLNVSGGNGFDGQTLMTAVNAIEMGGTLTLELSKVALSQGSDGVLAGLYSGTVAIPSCFAGFRIKGSAGAASIVALVNGAETGTAFTFSEGHLYTLRLRLHCAEIQRVLQSYNAVVNGSVQSFGGGSIGAPMQMVFEVQDLGLASNTVGTVLYQGAVASSPAQCTLGLVNSTLLRCQIGSFLAARHGSAWITGTMSDGSVSIRRQGNATDQGADFSLSGNKLLFFAGREPAAGELVTVTYRRGARGWARLQNAGAVTQAGSTGLPGVTAWQGAVASPVPRSSADCASAAEALLAFNTSPSTGIGGVCELWNAQQTAEIYPGDRMVLPDGRGGALQLPVKTVTVEDRQSQPEAVLYKVEFGQGRTNGLSFTAKNALAPDVSLPLPISPATVLANLSGAQVVNATATALQIDAGVDATNGGGFEVRRRDGGFGTPDADLVEQSPVRSFSLPRQMFEERFYLRMYDGSTPPVYSALSSVFVTHLPLS